MKQLLSKVNYQVLDLVSRRAPKDGMYEYQMMGCMSIKERCTCSHYH